jgi:hypothetical protein
MSTKVRRREFPRSVHIDTFADAKIGDDLYRCAGCDRGFPQAHMHLDHIVECADGGGNHRGNAQLLCHRCHKVKTAWSARRRKARARVRAWRWKVPMYATGLLMLGWAVADVAGSVWADRIEIAAAVACCAVPVLLAAWIGARLDHRQARRRLKAAATAQPEPVKLIEPPSEATQLHDRIAIAAREVLGKKGAVVVEAQADRGVVQSIDLSYKGTGFDDHKDDSRADLVAKLTAKLGVRLAAEWDTENDRVTFTRRPDLPARVDHPGLPEGRPWHVIPVAPGVAFDLKVTSHVLIVGATNSGKTALIRSFIAAFSDSARRGQAEVRLGDPKRIELVGFRKWPGVTHIATTDEELWDMAIEVKAEMDGRFMEFEEDGVPLDSHPPLLLIIDEYEEYVERMFAYAAEQKFRVTRDFPPEAIRAVKSVLRMARRANIHMVIGTQRPDADWFGGSARENLQGRAGVGPLSPQAARMAFNDSGVGRDVPISAKGRTTVQIGDAQPVEIQPWYVPEPGHPDNTEADIAVLARLAGAS